MKIHEISRGYGGSNLHALNALILDMIHPQNGSCTIEVFIRATNNKHRGKVTEEQASYSKITDLQVILVTPMIWRELTWKNLSSCLAQILRTWI